MTDLHCFGSKSPAIPQLVSWISSIRGVVGSRLGYTLKFNLDADPPWLKLIRIQVMIISLRLTDFFNNSKLLKKHFLFFSLLNIFVFWEEDNKCCIIEHKYMHWATYIYIFFLKTCKNFINLLFLNKSAFR